MLPKWSATANTWNVQRQGTKLKRFSPKRGGLVSNFSPLNTKPWAGAEKGKSLAQCLLPAGEMESHTKVSPSVGTVRVMLVATQMPWKNPHCSQVNCQLTSMAPGIQETPASRA